MASSEWRITSVSTKKPVHSKAALTQPENVFGCLGSDSAAEMLREMDAGIAAEAKRRHACGRY